MERSKVFEAALAIVLICLAGLLCIMIASVSVATNGWEKQSNSSVDYMFVGSDDTLYAFSGNAVSAFSKDGGLRWRLDSPAGWKILNSWDMPRYSTEGNGGSGMMFNSYPIVGESNGSLYLFAIYALNWTDIVAAGNLSENSAGPDIPYISKPAKVMKISPEGKVVWEYSFETELSTADICGLVKPEYYRMVKPIAISVHGDRIYLFHDYTVDVLDSGGSRLFSISNASAPAAVDDKGRIYIVHAVHPSQEQFNQSMMGILSKNSSIEVGWDSMKASEDATYMLTSSTVEAYAVDGSLLWSHDIGANATRPFVEKEAWPRYNTLPLYANDRLYVPIEDGITAIDPDGRVNGTTHMSDGVYTLFPLMPLDSRGNVYMMKLDPIRQQSYIYVISPGGRVSRTPSPYDEYAYYDDSRSGLIPVGGKEGIVYSFENIGQGLAGIGGNAFNDTLASRRFTADTVNAYDVVNGREMWSFTIPKSDVHVVTLKADNAGKAIRSTPAVYTYGDASTVPLNSYSQGEIRAYHGQNVTYLNYYYSIFESPLVPNRSRCIYAHGIFAIDNNGKLLWEKGVDGFVNNVAVGNSTVYYSLDSGRMGGSSVNIVAGITLAAITYIVLRFFMIGTVARARSRLDQNRNRKCVLQYIIDHPGATLADMTRGLGMNMGTIRYHLLILSLNHRVVTYRDEGKFIRYFKNSGTYTDEERELLSLIRRRPLQKIVHALIENQRLSGPGLSKELKISEAAIYRHLAELCDKDIIEKFPGKERSFVYAIKAERLDHLKELLGRY